VPTPDIVAPDSLPHRRAPRNFVTPERRQPNWPDQGPGSSRHTAAHRPVSRDRWDYVYFFAGHGEIQQRRLAVFFAGQLPASTATWWPTPPWRPKAWSQLIEIGGEAGQPTMDSLRTPLLAPAAAWVEP
jgi:hypothetical protein